ncbi:MAG: TerB family tellurite resistance protein [Gammaproteobacteria bacterium]|nr:TerB family tellurite resistance protein [Gammaproteobacteria bacterium]
MIAAIRRFFDNSLDPKAEARQDRSDPLALATAALMIEVMRVESGDDALAFARVTAALEDIFDLPHAQIEELIELAEAELAEATDFYQFTRLINQHWGQAERIALIRNMWQVAWADGSVHHYEEHLIRRIADLIHVRHSDFIAAKRDSRPDT